MSTPLVAIIIPTYNRAALCERAIRSALQQIYKNIIIYVLDNKSEDSTAEMVRRLQLGDSRIVYHCHKENRGLGGNLSFGLSLVLPSNEISYFTFLCDDDFLLPDMVQNLVRSLEDYPRAAWWTSSHATWNQQGHLLDTIVLNEIAGRTHRNAGYYPPDAALEEMRFSRMMPYWSAGLFRVSAMQGLVLPIDFYTSEHFNIYPIIKGWGCGSSPVLGHIDVQHEGSFTYTAAWNDEWGWAGMTAYIKWLQGLNAQPFVVDSRRLVKIKKFFMQHGAKQGLLGHTRQAGRIAKRLYGEGFFFAAAVVLIAGGIGSVMGGEKLFAFANHFYMHYVVRVHSLDGEAQKKVRDTLCCLESSEELPSRLSWRSATKYPCRSN